MSKILIFGAAGSGTTTLANKVSQILKIEHFDSDYYYWEKTDPPFTTKIPLIERQSNLKNDLLKTQNWIVSGSVHSWGSFIADMLTHAIFLYVSKEERMKRIVLREYTRYGARIEPGGDMHEHHQSFLEWAASYDDDNNKTSRTKEKHLDWASSLQCPVLKIENDNCDVALERMIDWITLGSIKT